MATPPHRTEARELSPRRRLTLWRKLSAPQLFAGSFGLLVLAGAAGLKLLPGLYTGAPLSWLDALFTATSAVCVTGLVVVDTATYFTRAGQLWLLLLIQLGGLGMITFTTVIILALGRRLSLRQELLSSAVTEVAPGIDYRQLTRDIVRFTLILELSGALLLFLGWRVPFGWQDAAWYAIFHAISAFCNAGFSTFSDSLIGFQRSPLVLGVIMALIVLGGIGFLTMEEVVQRGIRGSRRHAAPFRISLHSRLVLVTTAVLLLVGWILFTAFEWELSLAGLPLWARPFNSLFLSVTARTAGFNVIDYDDASGGTNFLTILLMSIGGSPGSTAGGLKTTTLAIIVLLAWSRYRGHEVTSIWGRTIPEETVQRSVGLFVMGFGMVTAAILGYVALEMGGQAHAAAAPGFLGYMFEAVSAFNTVGLSMGVTPGLSHPARWLTIFLMYLGRVGPLTFAAAIALARPTPRGEFRFAYEDVVVG